MANVAAAPTQITLEGVYPSPSDTNGVQWVGTTTPTISWIIPAAPPNWKQQEAEIEIKKEGATQRSLIPGGAQPLHKWPFSPLKSREQFELRVRVRGDDEWSEWSAPTQFEAALLSPTDWVAQMVGPRQVDSSTDLRRPGLIRQDFTVTKDIIKARIFVTAHGLIQTEINGRRVGLDELVPGWTVYDERLPYRAYDVTELIHNGDNAIGAWLGDGWYRGRVGFDGGNRNIYGSDMSALIQLEITHPDGTTTIIGTDESWQGGPGPILSSGLYEGEVYDAREYPDGWSNPGFTSTVFEPVEVARRDADTLYLPPVPPVRCTSSFQARTIEPLGPGRYLLDFGQNASGRLQIKVDAPAGTEITIRHAEVLEDGELGVRPLRRATSIDRYIADGSGPVFWQPKFTIHGFRYAEISGWPSTTAPQVEDIIFRVFHTDADRTGWFSCSNPRITKLHENVVWSTRSNFVAIPTDCPQRDERLGWTGDLQVFAPTALYLYSFGPMIADWLRDLWIEQQRKGGGIPVYVPTIPGHFWDDKTSIAVWGDVAVLAPWAVYLATGNTKVLEEQLDSASAWVDHIQALAGPSLLWTEGIQLGDWLDPAAPPENPFEARTDPHLVATAYLAHSTRVLALILEVLGKTEAAKKRFSEAERARQAFQSKYVHPGDPAGDCLMTSDTQTAYALAIKFGLLTASQMEQAGNRLAQLVRDSQGRIATGFAGTPAICAALEATGHLDEAYLLLENDFSPSWLHTVNMGATTTWERWDSMLPDGTINPGDMTSFNHYALGAVAEWLHTSVGGIRPAAPGYQRVEIAPQPGGSLRWARTAHKSPFGLIKVQWVQRDGILRVTGSIPVGATALLKLPNRADEVLNHGDFEREIALEEH